MYHNTMYWVTCGVPCQLSEYVMYERFLFGSIIHVLVHSNILFPTRRSKSNNFCFSDKWGN